MRSSKSKINRKHDDEDDDADAPLSQTAVPVTLLERARMRYGCEILSLRNSLRVLQSTVAPLKSSLVVLKCVVCGVSSKHRECFSKNLLARVNVDDALVAMNHEIDDDRTHRNVRWLATLLCGRATPLDAGL